MQCVEQNGGLLFMRRIRVVLLITLMIFITSCSFNLSPNPVLNKNKTDLEKSISETCSEYKTVQLNDLTPINWEKVYFFEPYASKSYIVEKVGFSWTGLKETVSEGMMQIVFIDKGDVVCYIYGYPEKYYINCEAEVLFSKDNPQFAIMEFPKNDKDTYTSYIALKWLDDKLLDNSLKSNISSDKIGKWEFKGESKINEQLVYKDGSMVIEKDGTVIGSFGYCSYNGDSKIEHLSGGGALEFIGQIQGSSAVCKVLNNNNENIKITFKDGSFLVELNLRDDFFKLVNGKSISMNGEYNYKK